MNRAHVLEKLAKMGSIVVSDVPALLASLRGLKSAFA